MKRFNFEFLQDFRAPIVPLEVVADNDVATQEDVPPPPPTFSESELEAAKKAAYAEGRHAGAQEEATRADTQDRMRQQQLASACTQLAQQVFTLSQHNHAFMLTQTEELSALVLMLARKVAGDATANIPQAGIKQMVEQSLAILQQQPKVKLCVHPDLVETMQQTVTAMIEQHRLETKLEVQADPALERSDARMEWHDGVAERNLDTIWQQIERAIAAIDFSQLVNASMHRNELQEAPVKAHGEPAARETYIEDNPTDNNANNISSEQQIKGEQA